MFLYLEYLDCCLQISKSDATYMYCPYHYISETILWVTSYCMRRKSTRLIFLLNSEFTVCNSQYAFFFSHFLKIGSVVIHTSADEPVTAIPRLKIKHGSNPSVSVGHYRLSGDKVCFMTDCLTVQTVLGQTVNAEIMCYCIFKLGICIVTIALWLYYALICLLAKECTASHHPVMRGLLRFLKQAQHHFQFFILNCTCRYFHGVQVGDLLLKTFWNHCLLD